MIWRQANLVGLAFRTMVTDALENDLDARLRESQRKKRSSSAASTSCSAKSELAVYWRGGRAAFVIGAGGVEASLHA